ncbi:helix-turn-helix transcriptional regulator [Hamadaea tsunoensis]|uniref:helix-turn-helix transcriptional regulator n=1 Tax=Hamadaea tsunoensis TaxID=53368 RepID=UPI0006879CB8|nr:LuxR family transcriptional regulator [Hamadaea tsunoensis]
MADVSADQAPQWSTALCGRDDEVARLAALFARSGSDDEDDAVGAAAVVTGDPGIGKSALLEAARDLSRSAGFRTLTTVGIEAEAQLPYSGLQQLLRPLMSYADRLPQRQVNALRCAFGGDGDADFEPFLVSLAALNLLVEAAADRPVAILADDVQWLDPQTHDTLAFLARRVTMDPIVIVGAIRSGYPGPLVSAGLPEIEIGRLTEATAEVLLRTQDARLSEWRRQRILREAAGNPLALIELPKAWRDTDDGRELPPDLMPVTSRLERSFTGRMTGLPADARDVLLIAAVNHGDELPEILAAGAVLTGSPVTVDSFDPVVRAGLARLDGGRVRFRHPLVRSAVVQSESVQRRLAANAALAAVLTDAPYRRAWHRAEATTGLDDTVADDLVESATYSMARGAAISAIRCLERAALLTADPGLRGHRLLLAAEHAFGLGRAELVNRLVQEASAYPLAPLDEARTQWLREIFHDGVPGDAGRIMELCRVADAADQAEDRDLALNLLNGAALRCWWADTGPRARAAVARSVRRLAGLQTDARYLAALAVAEPVLEAAAVHQALTEIPIEEISDPDALRLFGMAAHAIGNSALASDFLDRAEAKLRSQGRLGLLTHVLVMQVGIRLTLGAWDRAFAAAEEGRRLGSDTGQSIWNNLVGESRSAALRGELEEALRLAAQAEHDAHGRRLTNLLCCVQLTRGYAWAAAGRYEEAYRELRRLFDPTDPAYHVRESYPGIMFFVDAAVHTDRRDEARSVLAAFEQLARITPAPDLQLNLAYARAVLADDDEAEDLYQAALAANLNRSPWYRARYELAYGTWLRRQRRIAESRVHLRAALVSLELIGAHCWVEQARVELRAAGERTAQAGTSAQNLLSPQELHIARLAAQGLSNREIGEQLYLSPRTVGSHLYRIFPKLNITARAQLAARLDLSS